ncbi:hypothetical protein [Prevotella sp.]|uniref:hypothetical protein n=1 Tax=Prevotella sp. TaxID=59823 RepID=UPI003AB1E4CF
MTINETVKWFNSIFDINRNENQKKSDFTIGLTQEIEELKQNSAKIKLLGVTKCDNLSVAKSLIKSMRSEGFSVEEESIKCDANPSFVYLYKKDIE